jgi:hypothetical protein
MQNPEGGWQRGEVISYKENFYSCDLNHALTFFVLQRVERGVESPADSPAIAMTRGQA